MHNKPTKQMHTDGRRKSPKGVGGRGPEAGDFPRHRGTKLSSVLKHVPLIKFAAS